MIKWIVICFTLIYPLILLADKPAGFLWYNIAPEPSKKQKQNQGRPFNNLSFTERDAVLRFYTMESLHKARHTQKIEDMRAFLSLQDYWLRESTRFKRLFQKTMLAYPEYDYQVNHPTSQLGVKISDDLRQAKHIKKIKRLSKTQGFLFFYRGKSAYDLKQISIIEDFCKHFHFSLIPISVDGVLATKQIPSRIDKGQANRLNVHYFPALLLVNPKTQQYIPIAYGLTTQDVLINRINELFTSKGEPV